MSDRSYEADVCAVVVTFNRKDLLPRCLEALNSQSRKPELIIVVDNASTDGTPAVLKDRGYIASLPPIGIDESVALVDSEYVVVEDGFIENYSQKIRNLNREHCGILYVRMNSNTGGAGGFHEGQKLAHQLGFSWLWLMDDDGYPSETCLENLLISTQEHPFSAINPLVINCDEPEFLSFGLGPKLKTVSGAITAGGIQSVIYGVANPFNGTLISHKLISDIGYIKKEMFIWGDETEYFLRAKKYGFKIATIVSASFFHPDSKTVYKTGCWGLLSIAGKPKRLEMNYYRNLSYLTRVYFLKGAAFNILKSVLYYLSQGDLKKVCRILAYVKDGWFDHYKLKNLQD